MTHFLVPALYYLRIIIISKIWRIFLKLIAHVFKDVKYIQGGKNA